MNTQRGEIENRFDAEVKMSPQVTQSVPERIFDRSAKSRIVGLIPARNEGSRIEFCLRALSKYVEAIVYLDDCSEDNSVEIVESLAQECHVERIIQKSNWHLDESGDRNALLKAGRAMGGTHFVVVDADEAFTSNCVTNGFLRQLILTLQPGDQLAMNWIQLWRNVHQYRFDNSIWTWNRKGFIFCDDGKCSYTSEFVHTPRVPRDLSGKCYSLPGYVHGLLHFQFVNWANFLSKHVWYCCLERVRDPKKPAEEINKRYAPSKNEDGLKVRPARSDWFSEYSFFDPAIFDPLDRRREAQVLEWFKEYGKDYFRDLAIWDVDPGKQIRVTDSETIRPLSSWEELEREDSEISKGFLQKAEEAFNKLDLAQARDSLRRALDYDPTSLELTIGLGDVLMTLGDPVAARWEYVRAMALDASSVVAHNKLALAEFRLQRFEESQAALERALNIEPAHPGTLKLLGDLQYHQGRFSDAIQFYRKVARQTPDDLEVLLLLGNCYFKTGDFPMAKDAYERVLQLQPAHPVAQESLQFVLSKLTFPPMNGPHWPAPLPNQPSDAPNITPVSQTRGDRAQMSVHGYYQPPAGLVEKWISVEPMRSTGRAVSSYQALKDYSIRDFGVGFPAVEAILSHIAKRKFQTSEQIKREFWSRTVALPVTCELRSSVKQAFFDEQDIRTLDDLSPDLSRAEPARVSDIERYAKMIQGGIDLGTPLYMTGCALNRVLKAPHADENGIYMIDGARRITASALARRRSIEILLLLTEEEYARLLPDVEKQNLQKQLGALTWFKDYQSIPLVGIQGQRSLGRFSLIDMTLLRDQTVMDFGCNIGQACIQAVQAGAKRVLGLEGMPDTFKLAEQIRHLAGFDTLHYLQVDFNQADFDQVIDRFCPDAVDYAFFFSVYRTKELKQRERLFQYIINKTRRGIFFEGHAHPVIDSLDYYAWLFECFELKHQFLGYSEGQLRPLFYLPLDASAGHTRRKGAAVKLTEEGRCAASSRTPEYLVSALVSVYRCERFIEGKLRDLLDQSLGDRLEIIIIDSNSPENERAIIEALARQHSNIKYLRTEHRETLYQAWNRGIKLAQGKYVTNANADDRLRPDALAIMASELERNPDIALVYGDFFITTSPNMTVRDHVRCGYSRKPEYAPEIMLAGCHMGPQPMWRRSVHDEIGYFDEQFIVAGDYEFWCRLATKHRMKHLPDFLGLYYHNPAGIANQNKEAEARETALIHRSYNDRLPPAARGLPTGYYFNQPMETHRFVNIGMVTYNRLQYTQRAIDGLLKHTRFPHVVTVVDNASQDGTREYLQELKAKGVIKTLILLDENVGIAKASNLAWHQEPTAEYFLKFDNDIVIQKPDWLENMVRVIEAAPEIGVLGYNFEPVSYPLKESSGASFRLKAKGNIGGACILIPKRTQQRLGFWCEDYGLYSEEDADYGVRVSVAGLVNAYMADEDVGLHLPSGKAAAIDGASLTARDHAEVAENPEYRRWKDDQRRRAIFGGKFQENVKAYSTGGRSLYRDSEFAKSYPGRPVRRDPVIQAAEGHAQPTPQPEAVSASDSSSRRDNPQAGPRASLRFLSSARRPLRIGFLSVEPDHFACPYLRLRSPLEYWRERGMIECVSLSEFKEGQCRVIEENLAHVDVVVVQRQMAAFLPLQTLRRIAEKRRFKLVYELDDAFTEIPPTHPGFQHYAGMRSQIEAYLRGANLVTVSTVWLKARYQSLAQHLVVLPNAIDARLWSRWVEPTSGEPLRILFSGTPTHDRDFEIIESAVRAALTRQPAKLSLLCWGHLPKSLSGLPNVRVVESFRTDYLEYARLLQNMRLDFCLVPLEGHAYNQAKSHIKWLEYSSCGLPAVYSNVGEYPRSIRSGQTGLVINNSHEEWLGAILGLAEDVDLRKSLAEQAWQEVRGHHTLDQQAHLWLEAYSGLFGASGSFPSAAERGGSDTNTPKVASPAEGEISRLLEVADQEYAAGDFSSARASLLRAAGLAPDHPRIFSSLGAVAFALGDFADAQEHLAKASRLTPNDPAVFVQLALSHLKLDRIEDFESALGRALEIDPKHREALKLLADLNLQAERYKDAAEVYVKILKEHENDLEALLALGVCFFKLNDLETAQTVFERVLEKFPENALARENLDLIHQRMSSLSPVTPQKPEPGPVAPKPHSTSLGDLVEQANFFSDVGNCEAALESLQQAAELAPYDTEILSTLGSHHFTLGNYEAAREQFRRVIELHPRDPDAYIRLAMTCLKLDRIEEMESALGIALEIDPDHREALRFLAKTNLQNNRVRDAGRTYARLLEKRPDDVESLLSLGLCFYRGGELDAARMVYRRVLEFDPVNLTARENLFQLDRQAERAEAARKTPPRLSKIPTAPATGNLAEINRWLAQADAALGSKNLAGAREALQNALKFAPDAPQVLSALASLCHQLGDKQEACTLFRRLVEVVPTDPDKWVQLALAHFQLGEIEAFESALGRALELAPHHLEALRLLAHLNFSHGSIADAAQAYGKILKQTPDDLEVILALGVCFFKSRDLESAQMMFERALELDPTNSLASENLRVVLGKLNPPPPGAAKIEAPSTFAQPVESLLAEAETCVAEGKLAAACVILERASKLVPENVEVLATRGSLLFQTGEWERSHAVLARAVELAPHSADYQTRLALVLLKLDRVPESVAALERALEIDGNFRPALKLQADLRFRGGQVKEAAQLYHRILSLAPDDPEILLPLGVCFYTTGDLETAKMVFERLVKLCPEHELAQSNLETIRRKLAVGSPGSPAVASSVRISIIIPVLNQWHFTRGCLEAIQRNSPDGGKYEIIVIDNGSSDGTPEYLRGLSKDLPALRCERNETNVGFAKACNQGARRARGEFLLFLNNDTEPQPKWIEALLAILDRDSRVAAVGSKLLYPDGRIQQAGIQIVEDQTAGDPLLARNAFAGMAADWPDANQARVCQAVTAACLIVRKSCFEKVGGFDEEYWNGYEDVDFCFKLRDQRWLVMYQPESVVIHYESKSGPERFRKAQQNIARLHAKWLGKIVPDQVISKVGESDSSRPAEGNAIESSATHSPRPQVMRRDGLVSIVILTHNQLEHTRKCLESLEELTPEAHELILVDNGSTDGTVDFLKDFQKSRSAAKVIFNLSNRGFSAGNNQGLAVAEGDFVLLLNNDTVVTPQWLGRLLSVFERYPEVGIVGPVSNYVSGPQRVASVDYQSLEDLPRFARAWAATRDRQIIEINRVVGFCLLARRAVVQKIGGLDERFGSGNFEDDDFCIRARLAGFKAVVAQDVFIHHTGSATFRGAKIDYSESLHRNWELFKSKWGLPPDSKIEQGYRTPQAAFEAAKHFMALPTAEDSTRLSQARAGDEAPSAPPKDDFEFVAPPVARLASLQDAHEFLAKKKHSKAWNACLEAIRLRPFHPDAYLQMADIALAAGDERQALLCAERLIRMTPNWELARKVHGSLKGQKSYRRSKVKWAPLPPQLDQPRLSVCLIVKNEEEFLARCLASVKPIASQIVVVDTGSTDKTVEIAQAHGAEVHFFAWNDNFSDARNAAHQHARGDWVLILDADEELPSESLAKLAADMAETNVLGYRIPICNLQEAPDAVTYVPRLFRNAPALFFVSRVHEQIYATVLARKADWAMEAKLGTATIVHHGYDPGLVQRRQKIKRNLRLLEKAIVELPNEAALVMNYGLDLVNDGRLEEGLEKYRQAFRIMEPHQASSILPEVRERLLTLYGVHLMRANRFEEILEIMTSPLARDSGPTASMSFLAALALMKLERPAEAIPHLRECLDRRNLPAMTPPCREIHKAGPHHLLADCFSKNGQMTEAEVQFKLALNEEPQSPGILHDYALFLHGQKRSVEALQSLNGAVANGVNDERLWHLGGFVVNSQAEFLEFGLEWTGEAVRFFPDHPGIRGFRAETLFKAGRIAEALPFFRGAADAEGPATRAAIILCEVVLDQPLTDVPSEQEAKISAEFIGWYRRLLATNAKPTVLTVNSRVDLLRRMLPTAATLLAQALTEAQTDVQ